MVVFCYRIEEGSIGVNVIWKINSNEEPETTALINRNIIVFKEHSPVKGVYIVDDELITLTDNNDERFVWVRPGI